MIGYKQLHDAVELEAEATATPGAVLEAVAIDPHREIQLCERFTGCRVKSAPCFGMGKNVNSPL